MNVNFTVFIDKILSGEKRQTIRKAGGKWENVKVGDKLTLYTGLRTKECRKLGEAEVESITDIEIYSKVTEAFYSYKVLINGEEVEEDTPERDMTSEMERLVFDDGFKDIEDFVTFFNLYYGDNFKGKIIKWKNFRKANNE